MLKFACLLMQEHISSPQDVSQETLSQSVSPDYISGNGSSLVG